MADEPTTRHPLAWCYRVGVNLARTAGRRRAVERRVLRRVEADPPAPDGAEALARPLPVRAAVLALPIRQRQAVVARHYLGLSVEETAVAMKCAPGTVTALTHQAIANLRRSKMLVGRDSYEEAEHGNH